MKQREFKETRSFNTRSLSALTAIALLIIIWNVFGESFASLRLSTTSRNEPNEFCLYHVKDCGRSIGTYFFASPVSIQEILTQAGYSHLSSDYNQRVPLPCDSVIRLRKGRVLSCTEPLPGEQLLAVGRKIDINRASEADLCSLPGIGKSLAGAIVDRRKSRGSFADPGELEDIAGIGPGIMSLISPHVEVRAVDLDDQ